MGASAGVLRVAGAGDVGHRVGVRLERSVARHPTPPRVAQRRLAESHIRGVAGCHGADAHVDKPFEFEKLEKVIAELLQ